MLNSFGVHLTEVTNYGSLDVVLNTSPGGIGVLKVTLPLSFNAAFLLEDGRIGVYRSINGRPPYLNNGAIFNNRYINFGPNINLRARAPRDEHPGSADYRLPGRMSDYCTKGPDFADDLIKTYSNQNLLARHRRRGSGQRGDLRRMWTGRGPFPFSNEASINSETPSSRKVFLITASGASLPAEAEGAGVGGREVRSVNGVQSSKWKTDGIVKDF